jgi:hypothetical protein
MIVTIFVSLHFNHALVQKEAMLHFLIRTLISILFKFDVEYPQYGAKSLNFSGSNLQESSVLF